MKYYSVGNANIFYEFNYGKDRIHKLYQKAYNQSHVGMASAYKSNQISIHKEEKNNT